MADKKKKHEKSGKRLIECMKMNHVTNTDLSDWLENEKGILMDVTYISQMRNGWRPISYDNAQMFAEFLGIDPNYLLGIDRFGADSYEDYLEATEVKETISKIAIIKTKLERYLKPNGYSIIGFAPDGDDENAIAEYTFNIRHGKAIIRLTYEELIQFNLDVDEYVKLSAQKLFKKHQFD